jgi:DNA-binding MarR family transcriptional regulator
MAKDGTRPKAADTSAGQRPFMGTAFLLSSLGFEIARRFATTLQEFEIEPRQFALLRAISFTEGLSQQALGERLQIPASRMVAIIDDLEQRGLVERRQNPDDRRARALYLTPAGKELFEKAFKAAVVHQQAVSAPLSDSEHAQLAQLLAKVAHGLGVTPGAAHSALRESWPR